MATMNYSRSGEIIEIIIREKTGRKLESHHIPMNDKAMYLKVIRYIESKYGLKETIEPNFVKNENSFVEN